MNIKRRDFICKLNEIEIEILNKLYNRDYLDEYQLSFKPDEFPLTVPKKAMAELGHYLERLDKLNYVSLNYNALSTANGFDNKFNNNTIHILWDEIKLEYNGKEFIERKNMTFADKIWDASSNLLSDLLYEFRMRIISHIVSFVLGIGVTYFIMKIL